MARIPAGEVDAGGSPVRLDVGQINLRAGDAIRIQFAVEVHAARKPGPALRCDRRAYVKARADTRPGLVKSARFEGGAGDARRTATQGIDDDVADLDVGKAQERVGDHPVQAMRSSASNSVSENGTTGH